MSVSKENEKKGKPKEKKIEDSGELTVTVKAFLDLFDVADIAHGVLPITKNWYTYPLAGAVTDTSVVMHAELIGRIRNYYSGYKWSSEAMMIMMVSAHISLQSDDLKSVVIEREDWGKYGKQHCIPYLQDLPCLYECRKQQKRHKNVRQIAGYNDGGTLRVALETFTLTQVKYYLLRHKTMSSFIKAEPTRFRRAIKKFRTAGWWFTVKFIKTSMSKYLVSWRRSSGYKRYRSDLKKGVSSSSKKKKAKKASVSVELENLGESDDEMITNSVPIVKLGPRPGTPIVGLGPRPGTPTIVEHVARLWRRRLVMCII